MFARLALAATLTALTIVPSQAIEWMHRKAGLWSITMSVDGVQHMPGAMRMCLDATTDAKLMDHSMSFQPKDCDPAAMSGMGASHTVDLTCHVDGGLQKTHIVMSFAGDAAYHMGTVWSWLLGPFARAHFRVYGDARLAQSLLEPMAQHVNSVCMGTVSEIFDGDAPHNARGCFAQAWSVAEILRSWIYLERKIVKPSGPSK